MRCLSTSDDLLQGGDDITVDVVVSKDLQQITDDWGVSLTNKFVVVQFADDFVDLVTVDNIVEVNIIDILNIVVVTGWEGEGRVITVDGVNIQIDRWNGDNSSNEFPNVVKGKGLEDGVQLNGDTLGDEELLEEGFLHDDVLFKLGSVVESGLGDNLLVNLDINDLGWLIDDLGLSSDWLNNDFLVGWGNLNVSSDLGDFTDSWLVEEEGLVDLVQKEFVVDTIVLLTVKVTSSEDWGGVFVLGGEVGEGVTVVGKWVQDGRPVSSVAQDFVQVVSNGDITTTISGVGVVLDIVVGVVLAISSLTGV